MSPFTPNERQRRILQLSHEWGVALPPAPVPLSRPSQIPTFQSPADEQAAEALLQRRAAEAAQLRQRSSLSRAFSSNNLKRAKAWDPRDILDALSTHIANGGSPGVTEALIGKLSAAGVDLSGAQKQKSGLLSRRRSIDFIADRTKLLRLAVEAGNVDTVHALLPHADSFALDASIPAAIRKGDSQIVELLLRYGANTGETADGQDAFRHACAIHGQAQMISMILSSQGRPAPALVSQAMCDASRSGSLENVLQLSRTTADGNHNQAEALVSAVKMGRRDIAVAIITGNKPPQTLGLNEAFRALYDHPSLNPRTKLEIAELLLCAGAAGDAPARALEQACRSQFYEMAQVLSKYNASIEYNEAAALKFAIHRGDPGLVKSLLTESAVLNASLASSCVPLIPKQSPPDMRYALLLLLLHKGANGPVLGQSLIDAAESSDLKTVDLLLNAQFAAQPAANTGTEVPAAFTHATASPDFRSGEALRTAVIRGDLSLARKLLAARPSPQTITTVFPLTKKLPPLERHKMVELFLGSSLSGECLHAALQDAISPAPSERDDNLIKLLLNHGADINYGNGEGLVPLIKQMDLKLLNSMLQSVSPQTAAARVPDAMLVSDHRTRFEIMSMLLRAGAVIGVEQIAAATLNTLTEKPVDMSLLRLLLESGTADVNAFNGTIISTAIANPDPKVLDLVLQYGKSTQENIAVALNTLVPQFSNDSKTWKLRAVLSKADVNLDLSRLLILEIKSLIEHKARNPSLEPIQQLLDANADPNGHSASSICHATSAGLLGTLKRLFHSRHPPTPVSLGLALPHALRVSGSEERLAITTLILQFGAPPREVGRALMHAINTCPDDLPLIRMLSKKADVKGIDTLSHAVAKESASILRILLENTSHSPDDRNAALSRAMDIKNRGNRNSTCKLLLASGVTTQIASGALLVAARDGDVQLGDMLMAHGASISSNNGQAIVEASRGGSVEVLKVLLRSDGGSEKKTLYAAFQAATEVSDLNKRAVIFHELLKLGVAGELVDAQLLSAARSGEDGAGILKVLLAAGADPNYNKGEAVVAATRSAFIGSLELLLGLWNDSNSQKLVSHPTLIRALKVCWPLNRDTRFVIVDDLLKAGLPVCEELHMALNDAVNEEGAEERMVKLLLESGANPAANGCKTVVDAAQKAASSSLALLLQRDMASSDINRAFNQAFTSETFTTWFTERGLQTARMLLDKGAKGDSLSTALVLVMKSHTDDTKALADQFVSVLISHGPDVNFNGGQPLQLAASRANISWTRKLLDCRPTSETLSSAFQCIFDTALSQDEVLELFKLFAEHREADACIDVMAVQRGSEPVLVRAMKQYPRSLTIVSTLLDAGYYHDQLTPCQLLDSAPEEEVSLLTWALAQPQKRVSTGVIELLVDRGATVNATAPQSGLTPLTLAVQNRRPDVVKLLLVHGAEVDVVDSLGRTPLSIATDMSGDVAVQMMTSILAAEPCRDDGSLHNAARELNLSAVKVLVHAGHDPDFPSPLHQGRSALGELCLRASSVEDMTLERERTMQKVMTVLIDSGSDLAIKANEKSLLHLCFDSAEPVTTTKSLLKAGMWKHVNKPFNRYTDDKFTYSPTMYVAKVLSSDYKQELLSVLRASRAADVYYANSGPQPNDAVGLPDDMATQERARKARLQRLSQETEDHAIALARKREIAGVEQQILMQRAEMEDARRRRQHSEELSAIRSRAQLEESIASSAQQKRLAEQRAVTDAALSRSRAIAAAETDADDTRQRKAIEWEGKMNKERVDNARALSAVKISEREHLERIDKGAEQRIAGRIEAQKKLVDSQERLARRLADGPGGNTADARRQIGYVTELN